MDLLTSEEYPDVRGLMGTSIEKPNRARATQWRGLYRFALGVSITIHRPWQNQGSVIPPETLKGEMRRGMGRVDLLIKNWFYKKSKGRQCKGRNSDFFQLILNAHWTIFLLSHYSLRSVLLLSYHSLIFCSSALLLCVRGEMSYLGTILLLS